MIIYTTCITYDMYYTSPLEIYIIYMYIIYIYIYIYIYGTTLKLIHCLDELNKLSKLRLEQVYFGTTQDPNCREGRGGLN